MGLEYKQEFDVDNGNHRILCSDGRETPWALYTQYAYMDGWVSCTGYYLAKEGIYTANDFLRQTAVCEVK